MVLCVIMFRRCVLCCAVLICDALCVLVCRIVALPGIVLHRGQIWCSLMHRLWRSALCLMFAFRVFPFGAQRSSMQ